MAITLKIVTPVAKVYNETVASVVLPTTQGEVGILPGHIPLLTMLEAGELQVTTQGGSLEFLAVDKGFAEVKSDQVTVVTEAAIQVEEIDMSEVEDARARAEKALEQAKEEDLDPDAIEQLEAQMRFAMAQQMAKARKKN